MDEDNCLIFWSLLPVFALFVGFTTSQYVQQQQQRAGVAQQQQVQQSVQAAQPDAIDQIPAWYQMAKPVASRVQQLPQASPSYYERHEPTYEQRREQPTYERPGIQTNQYANYPSYQNRQPYENLNALASGASLSNLQANRRFPSSANSASVSGGAGGSDVSRLRHVMHHAHHTPPTPSPAFYTRHHHPGRLVWYTSPRVSPYNVIRTTPAPPPSPHSSLSHEIRGVQKLLAMTPYEQTKDQFSKWYDQMRAFYYINQIVDWGTFKSMLLSKY
uniref:Uncharacterized protein n=1 Tax=Caenorhabditis japonica TaxID=281687 RepID=A0A8R1DNB3_CAEJA